MAGRKRFCLIWLKLRFLVLKIISVTNVFTDVFLQERLNAGTLKFGGTFEIS